MLRTLAHAFLGLCSFVLGCELLFRALPVSTSTQTGYYLDPAILSYPAHHEWRTATGWDLRNPQRLRSNNVGFVSARDFVRDRNAIALIGDSYVEASMLPAADRPGSQLERALGGERPVYAMGSPGTALLDYAERIRFAHERFGISDFVVVMERGDVRQSLCGSGNIDSPCLDPTTLAARTETHAAPSVAKRLLRQSAFAQYVFGQLKVTPRGLWRQAFHALPAPSAKNSNVPTPSPGAKARDSVEAATPEVDAVTRAFFERIKPYATGRLVLVVDSDRAGLQHGPVAMDRERRRFIGLARAAGAVVIDTEPLFRAHFMHSSLALSVGPYDGHFNALGVQIVADAAANALRIGTR